MNLMRGMDMARINGPRMKKNRGFVLITTLMLMIVFMTFLSAYNEMTRVDISTTKSTKNSSSGFYAAEAGLNVRADEIRKTFVGYNRPSGTSPTATNPCEAGNNGLGAFACLVHTMGKHSATSYVTEPPGNPLNIKIPTGERFQGLSAQEYQYKASSKARLISGETEAMLELTFKSRLVPLFQFAAFYNKDLEINPGADMTLNGPVHTNGDLYLNANTNLDITGQVTAAGNLYRGRKNDGSCLSRPVRVTDPLTLRTLLGSCPNRTLMSPADLTSWNGNIEMQVEPVLVPEPESMDPVAGRLFWDKADLRLVLNLSGTGTPVTTYAPTGVEVRNVDDTVDTARTTTLNNCVIGTTFPGTSTNLAGSRVIGNSNSFYSNREVSLLRLLEVDMQNLFNCIQKSIESGASLLEFNRTLGDTSEDGLVLYFTVKGPLSGNARSLYGTRVRNAQTLQSNIAAAQRVRGVSIISEQALFSLGDFNNPAGPDTRVPAAFMGDSYNVLSNAWPLAAATDQTRSQGSLSGRVPTDTVVNAAILSGSDTTGGSEGTPGQGGAYNGGLENFPRFHEDWGGTVRFTYLGSLVSLNRPRRANGPWIFGGAYYTAPNRAWSYDTTFNSASSLPPLTPRFVYLRQQLFVRDFEE